MYKGGAMKGFTRDLVYVRPGTFVLFDRTSVASASADQWMSFHLPNSPASAGTSDGSKRFDVSAERIAWRSSSVILP